MRFCPSHTSFISVVHFKLNSTGFKNRGVDCNTAGLIQIKTPGDLQLPSPSSMPCGFFKKLNRATLLLKNIFIYFTQVYPSPSHLPFKAESEGIQWTMDCKYILISYLVFVFQPFPKETISVWVNHMSQYLSKGMQKKLDSLNSCKWKKRCAVYTQVQIS